MTGRFRSDQKESVVLKQCLEYLKWRQIFCYRNNTGCYKRNGVYIHYGYNGSSDIIGILPDGRFLAVECKREKGGRLSEKQVEFLDTIKKNGGVAVCVNSVDELAKIIKTEIEKKQLTN